MSNAGRNEPCPCGSGKKYKKCGLAKEEATRGIAGFPVATKFDIWQVELVPVSARIETEPAARFVVPFIMGETVIFSPLNLSTGLRRIQTARPESSRTP